MAEKPQRLDLAASAYRDMCERRKEALCAYMRREKLTQRNIADRLGCSRPAIGHWVRGIRYIDSLRWAYMLKWLPGLKTLWVRHYAKK